MKSDFPLEHIAEMVVQATGRTDLDVSAKSVREKLQTALDSV